MQVVCPRCGRPLKGDEINVGTNLAGCRDCSEVYRLSNIVQAVPTGPADRDNPPSGSWYREEFGGFVVGATTRSLVAVFLVPFMLVWSGGLLGGIYGSQIARRTFNPWMSLFGIPFLLGTLAFGSLALMTLCGQVIVRLNDLDGEVFTGIGPLGWRRRFDAKAVTGVRVESSTATTRNGNPTQTIVLDGPSPLRFGSLSSENRRNFLANVLRQERLHGKPHAFERFDAKCSGHCSKRVRLTWPILRPPWGPESEPPLRGS
jgi:hypothetical protein